MKQFILAPRRVLAALAALVLLVTIGGCNPGPHHTDANEGPAKYPGPHDTDGKDGKDGSGRTAHVRVRSNPGPRH